MKRDDFLQRVKDIADLYSTAYVQCCFGAPMNEKNKTRYIKECAYNTKHSADIKKLSADTFGFDCVCLIKGILWGWNGNKSLTYGGAKYNSNGVPDLGTEQMIEACYDVSKDFEDIEEGELVWLPGHVGVYIGNGNVIECTPKWEGGVQYSKLGNSYSYASGHYRVWQKHGKLPWIEYPEKVQPEWYTVKKGDSLWKIAQQKLGNGNRWRELQALNGLKGTDIYPNQKLLIHM